MSTLRANLLLAADGNLATPPSIPGLDKRFASAWVNFNGVGVVAINDAYNVASITDNDVGDYTINFTAPMANANFASLGTTTPAALSLNSGLICVEVSRAVSSIRVNTVAYNAAKHDVTGCSISCMGGRA